MISRGFLSTIWFIFSFVFSFLLRHSRFNVSGEYSATVVGEVVFHFVDDLFDWKLYFDLILAEAFCLCLRSVVSVLHSHHPGQSDSAAVAASLLRYPFQMQSGVTAVTPLVTPKDCNQWPLIWVSQLSCCAFLMYCEPGLMARTLETKMEKLEAVVGGQMQSGRDGAASAELTSTILLS